MPNTDPPDDYSQLPTADGKFDNGLPARSPSSTPPAKKQTRIGPRNPTPEETQPPLEQASAPQAEEHHPAFAETEVTPAPPPRPRKTVVGPRRAQPPEDEPADLSTDDSSATAPPAPQPEPAPPRKPRRTVVGPSRPQASETETQPEPAPAASKPPNKVLNKEGKPAKKPTGKPIAASPLTQKPSAKKEKSSPSSKDETKNSESTSDQKTDGGAPDEVPEKEKAEDETASPPAGPWRHRWEKWGGRAFAISVIVHLLLLGIGTFYVVTQVMEPQVDFLPGGGTQQGAEASQALEHKIQQKKTPWLKKPVAMRKIAAVGSISDIVLPDEVPDLLELPQSRDLLQGGALTAGMGLAGAGGGFGKGMGLGTQGGMVFSLFGMQIKAKQLALVLDVSSSMAPHLPRVIEEVDKVAKDSVVILYVGCGLEPPPPRGLDGKDVISTAGTDFEKFWRLGGATQAETRKYRIDSKQAIPSEAIFRLLSKRPKTYFIHNVGLGYTWLALLCDQVRNADGLYWFSDFQDQVDFKQVNIVRENLQARKQRLYMHAYMQGSSYDLIRTQLVEPTQGDVKLEE